MDSTHEITILGIAFFFFGTLIGAGIIGLFMPEINTPEVPVQQQQQQPQQSFGFYYDLDNSSILYVKLENSTNIEYKCEMIPNE